MDLRTYYPYSLLRYGIIASYPSLNKDIKTDVAIIGAGISGALAAWHLYKSGVPCILIDKGHVAQGSTAASTSLIQYEIDIPLYKLIKLRGVSHATRSYALCRQAIYDLEEVCQQVNDSDNFEKKCSLQFASYKKDVEGLKKEYQLRKELGFKIDYLNETEIINKFDFKAPAALYSHEAGQVDAYLLTHKILKALSSKGYGIYDHTPVVSINYGKRNIVLITQDKTRITAKNVIIACGYESKKYLDKKLEDIRCTYAVISEPLPQKKFWSGNCLIWETADPYLYIRATADQRIVVGGKDTPYLNLKKQLEKLPDKSKALQSDFQKLFPHLPIKIDFSWAGAFAATKDGLPYIGTFPGQSRMHFALGYGGNGITFSVLAAQLIAQSILGKKHPDIHLFSFDR